MAEPSDRRGFRSTFYSFANRSCEVVLWERYFVEYDAEAWDHEGGGTLEFRDECGRRYSLSISHPVKGGFFVLHGCEALKEKRFEWSKVLTVNPDDLKTFIEIDDAFFPRGCLAPPLVAWEAVNQFLLNPTLPSLLGAWTDEDLINWPEL